MKLRNGFVTNSSSSNFVIGREGLTPLQEHAIINHIEIAKQLGFDDPAYCEESDRWNIEFFPHMIECSTFMDNFDMRGFLTWIGVCADDIRGDKYP